MTEEPVPGLLRELLAASGPSGYEAAPTAAWRAAARTFTDDVRGDTLGSSVASVPGRSPGLRLAIVGHIDEIGLIVTHVDDEGFVWFRAVGGWDAEILIGQRVRLSTREGALPGVIGKKPIHLLREEERKKTAELRDLHIDVGAPNGEEASRLVGVGDVAVIDGDPLELCHRRLASRALDNRLGAYVALEVARAVAGGDGCECEVAAVAAVQEEVSFGGSRTVTFELAPTVAVVVDVTHATDAPGLAVKEMGSHGLGSGAVINRGSIIHPQVFELLRETAEGEGIPFSVEASGRGTGTDADAIHLSRGGVPTGVVSIPLRYMHSPVEVVDLDDVDACIRLLVGFARKLTPEQSFQR